MLERLRRGRSLGSRRLGRRRGRGLGCGRGRGRGRPAARTRSDAGWLTSRRARAAALRSATCTPPLNPGHPSAAGRARRRVREQRTRALRQRCRNLRQPSEPTRGAGRGMSADDRGATRRCAIRDADRERRGDPDRHPRGPLPDPAARRCGHPRPAGDGAAGSPSSGRRDSPIRPSNGVMRDLRRGRLRRRRRSTRTRDRDRRPALLPELADAVAATGPVDIVDVFRRADLCVEHAREAVAAGARCLWLQLGHRQLRGRPDRPRRRARRRHGPLHDHRAPPDARPLSARRPAHTGRSTRHAEAPHAPDPPPRRARRLRAGRPAARRPEPGDAHGGPLRRRPRGHAGWSTRNRGPARLHRARSTGSRSPSRRR